jgi:phosphatidylglycerol:prolipoprotein diacylglycerol transferase
LIPATFAWLPPIHPVYGVAIFAALALAAFFPVSKGIDDPAERRHYYRMQVITLLGGVVGAKLAVVFGETGWPFAPAPDHWQALLWSGRSITGALIGGLLAAELAKPLTGYRRPPNDRFAAVLPFSIAVGRVGCLTEGCCRGAPWDGWCAVRYADGVPRHPAQAYEILFQVAAGVVFIVMVRRGVLFGRVFSLYLVAYGAFRFLTEYVRDTPRPWALPVSAYQVLAAVMVALGGAFLIKRSLWPPAEWERYRPPATHAPTSQAPLVIAGETA